MAERVVDVLEAVEVEQQQRERRAVALRQRERELDAVGQQARGSAGRSARRCATAVSMRCVAGELLGDVAERVDAADRPAVAALRQRHALEHLARVQRQHVAGLQQRRLLDRGEAAHVGRRVGDAAAHPVEHARRRRAAAAGRAGMPHSVGEAAVEVADAAGQVGDQDAVGGRFERRAQLGRGDLELALGAAAARCGRAARRRQRVAAAERARG